MSSFPLLNLPLVALQNVGDYWNPIDWYQFSKISGKTKGLTKSLSKPIGYLELKYGKPYYITLNYRKTDWLGVHDEDDAYEFRIGEIEERFMHEQFSWHKNPGILSIPSDNPSVDVLSAIEAVLEIFKCPLNEMFAWADGLTDVQFNQFIIWTNSLKQQSFTSFTLETKNKQKLGSFLQNFKKQTDYLRIQSYYEKTSPDFSDFRCHSISDVGADWIGLKQLFAFDFISCFFANTPLTNRDVNTFLKNWKECKTHLRMKECDLGIKEQIHVITILEGLSPEGLHRNDSNQEECQIRREDGKLAKIVFGDNGFAGRISIYVL